MREKLFYGRASRIQGLNSTVFANEAFSMSTMPDTFNFGKKVARRLAEGDYFFDKGP